MRRLVLTGMARSFSVITLLLVIAGGPSHAQTCVRIAPDPADTDSSNVPAINLRKWISQAQTNHGYNFRIDDDSSVADRFIYGLLVDHWKTGGAGHREAVHARLTVTSANTTDMLVGLHGACLDSSDGHCFGLNGYAWAKTGAKPSTEIVGAELNTRSDVDRVTRKVGLQVVDVTGSKGNTDIQREYSSAIAISAQGTSDTEPAADGWKHGLYVGPMSGVFPVKDAVIRAENGSASIGMDLSAMTFSTAAITLPATPIGTNSNKLQWGNNASVESDGTNIAIIGGRTSVTIENQGNDVVMRRGQCCYVFDWSTGGWARCQGSSCP
jgi:hypothetical protein